MGGSRIRFLYRGEKIISAGDEFRHRAYHPSGAWLAELPAQFSKGWLFGTTPDQRLLNVFRWVGLSTQTHAVKLSGVSHRGT